MPALTVKSVVSWSLILLCVIFILQNLVTVEVKFLMWSLAIPRGLLVAIMVAIGFLIGWLFAQHRRPKSHS